MDERLQNQYLDKKRLVLDRYFQRMNEMQRRAVFHMDGPLLILAGAGSGKTTVLINRIENMIRFGNAFYSEEVPPFATERELAEMDGYLEGGEMEPDALAALIAENPVRPWNILAITFTNKAAGELKNRLAEKLGSAGEEVHASTFHSLCVRILRREIEALGYNRSFAIYDTDDSLRVIREGIKAVNLDEKMFAAKAVLAAISRSKDTMTTPGEMLEGAGADYRMQCIAKVYDYYQKRLRDASALDFDDIIVQTVRLFQQHPQVLEHYQNRYRYVMVDEYQDTNHTQYLLVSMLAGRHRNLCVVGDDDQSIYKFRGATIENILSFESQFEDAVVIRLEQNYRSTQNILSAANRVIANNTARKGKNLWTSAGDGEKVRLVLLRDEVEESRAIADSILDHVKEGARFSDHAVLYRMNAQSNTVEKALAKNAVPYRIVGGLRFYERKEIKDMVAYLSVLNNHQDALRLLRVINEPKRGIGNSTLSAAQEIGEMVGIPLFEVFQRAGEFAPLSKKAPALTGFTAMMEELEELAEEGKLDELLDALLDRTGYRLMLESQGFEGAGRLENIMELKTNILKYMEENRQAGETPTLSGFLEEIALYTDLDNYDPGADAVVLMTVHSAKGLEFDYVYIAGMEEGIFPGRSALSFPEEIEEERRLAYVAITRAKKELVITSSERRMIFGQTVWSRPSRFASEIPGEFLETEDRKTPRKTANSQQAAPRKRGTASSTAIGVGGKPAAPAAGDPVALGDRVRHKTFGEGVVTGAKPMGNDMLLEVQFDRVGPKKIMANFARLEKA